MKRNKLFLQEKSIYILCAVLGAAVFFAVYGPAPLNPSYDSWIFNGYIETDIVQRYAGWLAYRGADSFLPPTFSHLINYPFGDYTSLADSIPAAEMLFKSISPLLPSVFQFCGLLCLFNMIMQAFCAAKLLALFTESRLRIFLGAAAFCFSPILLERLFRHTSLSFHWLILLAMYLYFKGKREKNIKASVKFALLTVLSVWLHLYFTPMLAGFFAAYVFDAYRLKKESIKHYSLFAASLLAGAFSAFWLGLLNIGSQNTSGYGTMGLNLNALFNPVSLGANWWVPGQGKLAWSAFLPVRALAENNIESFNYLGLGVLLSLAILAFRALYYAVKNKKTALPQAYSFIKAHAGLLAFIAFSTLFAVSNVVCAFSYVLFKIPLPQFLQGLFNAFRASGRLFWSVNYILLLCAVLNAFTLLNGKRRAFAALPALLLVLQIADLSPVLIEKHSRFSKAEAYYNEQADAEVLTAVNGAKAVYFLELKDSRALCASLLKNGIANNLWLISRDGYNVERTEAEMKRVYNELISGKEPYESCAYATESADKAAEILKANPMLTKEQINGVYYIFSQSLKQ